MARPFLTSRARLAGALLGATLWAGLGVGPGMAAPASDPKPAAQQGAAPAGGAKASSPAATSVQGTTSSSKKAPGSGQVAPGSGKGMSSSGKSATSSNKGAVKSDKTTTPAGKPPAKLKQKPGEVLDVDWRDLLPENERAKYSDVAPPPEHGPLGEGGPPAVQKQSTAVNADLGGINVRMPGFLVPLGPPRGGLVTEFFLVPYIGACIHVPPPPTNQMVFVTSTPGIAADAIHEAYWVTGKMRVETRTTSLGTAAYAISASKLELYQY